MSAISEPTGETCACGGRIYIVVGQTSTPGALHAFAMRHLRRCLSQRLRIRFTGRMGKR